MKANQMEIGRKYNFINQPERLVYLGENYSGNGYWHQFAKVESPDVIWNESLDSELNLLEETDTKEQVIDDDNWILKPLNSRQRRKLEAKRHNKELAEHKEWIKKIALDPRKRVNPSVGLIVASMGMSLSDSFPFRVGRHNK